MSNNVSRNSTETLVQNEQDGAIFPARPCVSIDMDPAIDARLPGDGATLPSQQNFTELENTSTPTEKRGRGRPPKSAKHAVVNTPLIKDFLLTNRKRQADKMLQDVATPVLSPPSLTNPVKKSNRALRLSLSFDSEGTSEDNTMASALASHSSISNSANPATEITVPEKTALDITLLLKLLQSINEMKKSTEQNFSLLRKDVAANNELLTGEVLNLRKALEQEKQERVRERERWLKLDFNPWR